MDKPVMVNVRLSQRENAKLLEMAHKTRRSKSAVLRILLEQAEVVPAPDVRCRPQEQEVTQHVVN